MRTAALILFVCAFTAQTTAPLLREQVWTEHAATLAHDLTHAPGECLARRDAQIELGRALFRSPTLLGGPVARLGISCNACHVNGRANARFFLPELTDRAGAADVTSEWASAVRGDGVMNPRDIPDLVDVGRREALGAGRDPSLEHFVHGVVVEEFQGAAPPQYAFAAVIAYLRALDSAHCPPGEANLTLEDAADDVRRTYAAARSAAASGEIASADLAIASVQDALGRIVERLPAARFAHERRTLETLARDLIVIRRARDLRTALGEPAWRARFDAVLRKLAPREHETFFNEAALAAALGP